MGITLNVEEHEHLFGSFRQPAKGRLEVQSRAGVPLSGRSPAQNSVVREVSPGPSHKGLPAGKNQVHRQPMEPGSKGGFPPKSPEFCPSTDEYLLGQIFRPLGPRHTKGNGVHSAMVAPVEAFESLGVATCSEGDILSFLFLALDQNGFDGESSQGPLILPAWTRRL